MSTRDRERMLERLHVRYEQMLAQSLQGAVQIELGLAYRPAAIQNAVSLSLRLPEKPEQILPTSYLYYRCLRTGPPGIADPGGTRSGEVNAPVGTGASSYQAGRTGYGKAFTSAVTTLFLGEKRLCIAGLADRAIYIAL